MRLLSMRRHQPLAEVAMPSRSRGIPNRKFPLKQKPMMPPPCSSYSPLILASRTTGMSWANALLEPSKPLCSILVS